jgi:uncharacterized protein
VIGIEEARGYYQADDAAHDFDHVLRVLSLAVRIAREEGADLEVVRTAALLHDVGRAEEARTGCSHAEIGAERARFILAGLPPEKVAAVCEAIAGHRFRGDQAPRTLEAQVLYDADKLDSIGAVGVARAYLYGGDQGQRLWGGLADSDVGSEGQSPEHTPVAEFAVKLSRVVATLHTDAARRMGQARHDYMVGFFQRLSEEVRGER